MRLGLALGLVTIALATTCLPAAGLATAGQAATSRAAPAADFLPPAEVVSAAALPDPLPLSPDDPAWNPIATSDIPVFTQYTVRLNDARANAARSAPGRGATFASIKAISSPTTLAIRVEWADPTRDLAGRQETGEFGDAVAIEFPARFGKGLRLPHIAMGDEQAPVRLYMQRAVEAPAAGPVPAIGSASAPGSGSAPGSAPVTGSGGASSVAGEFVAAGFGSLTRVRRPTPGARMEMGHDARTGRWSAVFSRPLAAPAHSLARANVPVAFALWDGARFERGGNKRLSGWKIIRLPGFKPDPAYQRELAAEFAPPPGGSARRGQQKVAGMCAGCHRVGEPTLAPSAPAPPVLAPAGVAPDLAAIGGIATFGYLRASVLRPSEVIVRNLQLNGHYDKTAKPDAFRAYPNDEAYRWYMAGPGRRKTSKMPPFAGLPAQDVADIVAYLKTLDGAPVAPGGE